MEGRGSCDQSPTELLYAQVGFAEIAFHLFFLLWILPAAGVIWTCPSASGLSHWLWMLSLGPSSQLSPQEFKTETYRWHAIQEILPERCVPRHKLDCCYERGRGKCPFSAWPYPAPPPPMWCLCWMWWGKSTWQYEVDSGEKLQGCVSRVSELGWSMVQAGGCSWSPADGRRQAQTCREFHCFMSSRKPGFFFIQVV